MRRSVVWLSLVALPIAGCWKTELSTITGDHLSYRPTNLEVPPGWDVQSFDLLLVCPDGEPGVVHLVYPEEPSGPMKAAVLFPAGAFDYVLSPIPGDVVTGPHLENPPRLSRDWAVEQTFATLGMYPDPTPEGPDAGSLVAALANKDIAVLIPGNCWGDWWHNVQGQQENQFAAPNGDFFFRNGRAAADWSYRFLKDPAFAAGQQITLPIEIDQEHVYVLGIGEGTRGVGEFLSVDNNGDGTPDHTPRGIVLDSPVDDLGVYYVDTSLFASTVTGLNRIFPGGPETLAKGALTGDVAVLPDRTLATWSVLDPEIPDTANDALKAKVEAAGGVVWPQTGARHGVLNGPDDQVAAQQAVRFLLDGSSPDIEVVDTGSR